MTGIWITKNKITRYFFMNPILCFKYGWGWTLDWLWKLIHLTSWQSSCIPNAYPSVSKMVYNIFVLWRIKLWCFKFYIASILKVAFIYMTTEIENIPTGAQYYQIWEKCHDSHNVTRYRRPLMYKSKISYLSIAESHLQNTNNQQCMWNWLAAPMSVRGTSL